MNRCIKGVVGAFDGADYKNKEIHNACIKEAKNINGAREYPFIKDGYERDID